MIKSYDFGYGFGRRVNLLLQNYMIPAKHFLWGFKVLALDLLTETKDFNSVFWGTKNGFWIRWMMLEFLFVFQSPVVRIVLGFSFYRKSELTCCSEGTWTVRSISLLVPFGEFRHKVRSFFLTDVNPSYSQLKPQHLSSTSEPHNNDRVYYSHSQSQLEQGHPRPPAHSHQRFPAPLSYPLRRVFPNSPKLSASMLLSAKFDSLAHRSWVQRAQGWVV